MFARCSKKQTRETEKKRVPGSEKKKKTTTWKQTKTGDGNGPVGEGEQTLYHAETFVSEIDSLTRCFLDGSNRCYTHDLFSDRLKILPRPKKRVHAVYVRDVETIVIGPRNDTKPM